MKIHSAAILGAGAVGSYLLWGLTDKPGVTVSVVAEGARADRLRRTAERNQKHEPQSAVGSSDIGNYFFFPPR